MTVLPVVAREMGVLARRKSMYWSRWVTAVLALLVMLWLLTVSAAQLTFSDLGGSIFLILSSLCFAFTVLIGMQATADCVSEEKREGTLGLLFLTDLRSFDVITGKLAASSLQSAMAVIGVIPMLSLALLLGGVTLGQFGATALVLGNTMFLSLSIGVFVSVLSHNERKAMMGTFVGLFIIVLGPGIFSYLLREHFGFRQEMLAVSPLYNFMLIHSNPALRPPGPTYFWQSIIGLHLLAWVLLAVSAWILPKCISELPSLRFRRLRNFVDTFVYGRLEDRRKHRAELLNQNAFLWLASRERTKPRYAWGVLVFFLGLYLWVLVQFEQTLFDLAIVGALMFLTHLAFKIWAASEVCSRLIQDRRSGALELLLSTPLSVGQIAEGQSLALHRIFRKPIVILLILEGLLLYSGLWFRSASGGNRFFVYAVFVGTFLLDLWALKWVGLWLSLSGKSIERILIMTLVRVLLLPWLIYSVAAGFLGLRNFLVDGRMDSFAAIFVWGVISAGASILLGLSAREKFFSRFRDLAARRFEAAPEGERSEPQPVRRAKRRAVPAAPRPERVTLRAAMSDVFRQKPVVSSVVCALLLLVVGVLLRSEYWSFRLRRHISALSDAGAPVTANDASRFHPPLVPEENGFTAIHEFSVSLPPPALRGPGGAARPEQARAFVAANESGLRHFWRLPQLSRGHLDLFSAEFGQHQQNHMFYAAIAEADLIVGANSSGPMDRIEQSARALLAHARLLRQQPLNLAQGLAVQSLERLSSALERFCKADLLDENLLSVLSSDATRADTPDVLARILMLQRALFLDPPPNPVLGFRPGPAVRTTPFPRPTTGSFPALDRALDNLGGVDKTMVRLLDQYKAAISQATSPYPRRLDSRVYFNNDELMNLQRILAPKRTVPLATGYIPEAFWSDAAFVAQLHIIQVALAAERFQRRHGSHPPHLVTLVPEFLPAVPIDPYSGKPLSSVQTSEGLLIYSIGADLQDDEAGRPGKNQRTGADIVFTFR